MRIKSLSLTILFVCFFFKINAQTPIVTSEDKKYSADKSYEEYAYADAIKVYQELIYDGVTDEKILRRLGNSYYFIGELRDALKWYDQLFRINKVQDSEYLYKYAQCFKSVGNYHKADEILAIFNEKSASERRADLIRNNKNYLEDIKFNSGRFDIADAGMNSSYSDYGSAVYDNKLIFTSARDTGGVAKNNFKWTNKSFSKLYMVELMPDGNVSEPKKFRRKENGKYNESTPIFTKDGRTMYFTRNNFIDGKRGVNEKQVTLLKLYSSELIDGKWKNIKELPFNSDQYSTAHPALSVDEKTLYFASDMPGTLGQSDLYKVSINGNGAYGTPINLGPSINTEGRETFPFISEENELYFASDGRPGLGGLDVFVSKIQEDETFDEVQNVGEPVNSKQDDFAFVISKKRNGFFSSNRSSGYGLDDVYRFTETKRLVCEQELSGTVTDSETNQILSNVTLIIFDEARQNAQQVVTDENGNYVFSKVKCGKKYFIKTSKTDYEIKEVPLSIKKENGKTILPISIEKKVVPLIAAKTIMIKTVSVKSVKMKPIAVGTDLAKTLNIPMNFFDLGKATIRKTSEPQLQKIVDVLKQYPTLTLDIRSHTDSRQSDSSNMILSEKRAQSTKNWLVSKGIDGDRLSAKGFGETQLVNKCADGVKCTEQQHQQNRRSEFIITNM
ncbi:Peptidoglycan-associated lipoprotein [Flavobacterium bizetiae]|uniref:Peptidoglycan-associated lipoprotein n=1 Tax=Flavobacterium bizetiae TaxID=2704140 RepID=A0A6J4GJR5_9FLAO|nr:OmpA family protein [Flavobacterium bizetiae]CAA9199124.1 Peptidoglycan-associated lipoprotein [Flavobacterium bizetiae]CAD5342740.1 Peptidoglycan-associated lipoprotein [Flavobacterium bizetiae]CAD5348449.1 Peptidoglycan-associated lipoprotein [Flavobacterium bizetiae]